jgi:hypothetical protein
VNEVNHKQLAAYISTALLPFQRSLKLAESSVQDIVATVMQQLVGKVILAPDEVRTPGTRDAPLRTRGKFGVTEPWPFEPGHKPPEVFWRGQ